MKPALLVLGIVSGVSGFGGVALAQNYPWCAYYGAGIEAANCGFTTYRQCMETVSGIGGSCEENNTYKPLSGPASAHRPAVKRHFGARPQ